MLASRSSVPAVAVFAGMRTFALSDVRQHGDIAACRTWMEAVYSVGKVRRSPAGHRGPACNGPTGSMARVGPDVSGHSPSNPVRTRREFRQNEEFIILLGLPTRYADGYQLAFLGQERGSRSSSCKPSRPIARE